MTMVDKSIRDNGWRGKKERAMRERNEGRE